MSESLTGFSRAQLCCVTITLAVWPAISEAQTGGGYSGPWQLYRAASGQHVATYNDVASCIQATATQKTGTLACRPPSGGSSRK